MPITDETIKNDIAEKIYNAIHNELESFYTKKSREGFEENNYSEKLEEDPEKSLTKIFDKVKQNLSYYLMYCKNTERKIEELLLGKQWEIIDEQRSSIGGCSTKRKTYQYKIYLMHAENSRSILEISIDAFAISVKKNWRILTKMKFTKFSD